MAATWTIEIDSARSLVCWQLGGYFDVDDVEDFHAESTLRIERLRASGVNHLGLSDIKEMIIQSQEVVNRFGLVLNDPEVMPLRHAVIVPPSLVRSQFLRVAPNNNSVKLFADRLSAILWLFYQNE